MEDGESGENQIYEEEVEVDESALEGNLIHKMFARKMIQVKYFVRCSFIGLFETYGYVPKGQQMQLSYVDSEEGGWVLIPLFSILVVNKVKKYF